HRGPWRHIGSEIRPAGGGILEARCALKALEFVGAVSSGVLHRDEQGLLVRGEIGAAHLGPYGAAEEQLRRPPPRAFRLHRVKPVRPAGLLAPMLALIGGVPEPALRVHCGIVRADKPAIGGGFRIPQRTHASDRWIAAAD